MTSNGSIHSSTRHVTTKTDGMMIQSEAAALSIDFVDGDTRHADFVYDDEDSDGGDDHRDDGPIMRSIRGDGVGARRAARLRRNLLIHRTILLTVILEGITCFMRFGLGMQSTRDTSALAKYTGGIRIHHGYIGIIMATASYRCCRDSTTPTPTTSNSSGSGSSDSVHLWMFPMGCALILSDLVHHFIVLYATTGDPHFDLVYPNR